MESPEAASGTRTVSWVGEAKTTVRAASTEENLCGFGEAGEQRAAVQDGIRRRAGKRWLNGEDDGRFWRLAHSMRALTFKHIILRCQSAIRAAER